MTLPRVLVAPIVLIAVASAPLAQRYLVHTYTEAEGLPSSWVSSVAQGHDGRMWFATRGGAASFDGYRWDPHPDDRARVTPQWNHVRVDARGHVWILSNERVARFEDGAWHELAPPPSTGSLCVVDGEIDLRDGGGVRVLLGCAEGGLLEWADGTWSEIPWATDGPPGIHAIERVGPRLLIGTGEGLLALDDDSSEPGPFALEADIDLEPVLGLAYEPDADALWVVSSRGVGRLEAAGSEEPGPFRRLTAALEIGDPHRHVPHYAEPDGHGGLFFGYRLGLFHVDPTGRLERLDRSSGLVTDGVTGLTRDREGHLWIGSPRGVCKLVTRAFASYDRDHGLFGDEVSAVIERSDGRMVLGHDGGLTFFDDEPRRLELDERHTLGRVLDIEEDRGGRLWIAVDFRGVVTIDDGGEPAWHTRVDERFGSVRALHEDGAGRLWLGTQRGVYVLDGEEFVPFELPVEPTWGDCAVRRITGGHGDAVLIATFDQGLFVVDADGARRIDHPSDGVRSTYTAHAGADGTIWVGTSAGLARVAGGELQLVQDPDLEVADPVYGLVEDGAGRLWIGTDRGVLRWDGERLEDIDVHRGLVGGDVNRAAAVLDSRGRVWIGTNRGVSSYRPHLDRPPLHRPSVQIVGLDVDGEGHAVDGPVDLGLGSRTVTFRFRAISFVDEQRVRFRTWLEGFEPSWGAVRQIPTRELRFTSLEPGTYRLHVQAIDALGIASATAESGEVRVPAPLHARPWVWALALLVAAGLTFGATRLVQGRRYARRLEVEVARRSEELASLERERTRAQSLRSLGVFAGGIAHDFNNLLTAILGNLELLEGDASLSRTARESLGEVQESCVRARGLTGQLLTFSKGGSPVRESASIAELVRTCATFVLRGSSVRCELDLPDDLPAVEIDAGQMSHVIDNLVVNALQASPPGGTVRVRGRERRGCVEIAISDEGPGVPPQLAERIFEPYFTTKEEGTGLGLALAASVVRQHDGGLELVQDGLPGCTFRLSLPTAEREETVAPRPKRGPVLAARDARVLVMDDDEAILDLMGRMLELQGCEVAVCSSGDEALARFAAARDAGRPFDLVILDLTVRGGPGGLEILEAIRALDREIRVVVASGYADHDALAHPERHGFQARLVKPFRRAELVEVLEKVLA